MQISDAHPDHLREVGSYSKLWREQFWSQVARCHSQQKSQTSFDTIERLWVIEIVWVSGDLGQDFLESIQTHTIIHAFLRVSVLSPSILLRVSRHTHFCFAYDFLESLTTHLKLQFWPLSSYTKESNRTPTLEPNFRVLDCGSSEARPNRQGLEFACVEWEQDFLLSLGRQAGTVAARE